MSTPLINAHELEADLDSFRVLDVRWKLGQSDYGRSCYVEGHIPGATFVDLETDLSAPPSGARHPLPEPDEFAATLGRLAVRPEDRVVVYDDAAGLSAARMWWMLKSIGHADVRLLDGGLATWVGGGRRLATQETLPAPTTYPAPDAFKGVVVANELSGRQVVDVRAWERYTGESEPIDPRAGHIPGAINLPATENLETGRFKSAITLLEAFQDLDNPIISCGSGVFACHTALALVVAGRELPDVYIGSFSDWSNSDRPVTTGDSP